MTKKCFGKANVCPSHRYLHRSVKALLTQIRLKTKFLDQTLPHSFDHLFNVIDILN